MYYEVRTRSKNYKNLVETIMPSIIKQLKLQKNKKFVLIDIGRSAGTDNDGMTLPMPSLQSFVISIKPGSLMDMGVTLAHEMVHVKQLVKGTLKVKNGVKYWCGKRYPKNAKYLNTPWELEAFARQEILFRRAIDI